MLKVNPDILDTFNLAEFVPKRCQLCDYVYVAGLDELVHYDICLEWRRKIAKLPKTQKQSSRQRPASLEIVEEDVNFIANRKALGQGTALYLGPKAKSISVNIVCQNVRHLDVDEDQAGLKLDLMRSSLDCLPNSDYSMLCLQETKLVKSAK